MTLRFPQFLYLLVQRSRSMMWGMVGVGALSGLCSAAILTLINRVLQQRPDGATLLAIGFMAAVAGKLLTQVVSQTLLSRFSHDVTEDLSLKLCDKILKAPFQRTESHGPANILVTLSDDVSMLAWSIQCLPNLAMNTAILAGCGAYLAWLSWQTFLLVAVATLLGAWGYHWLHARAFTTIYESRNARAQLFRQFRVLTDGLKELLMHQRRRGEFLNQELRRAADHYKRSSLAASRQYTFAEAWSQFSFYAIIGVILFVFPHLLVLNAESLTGYVVVLLYMMGPIWGIIGALPNVEKGQVAFDNITRLGLALDDAMDSGNSRPAMQALKPGVVDLQKVVFTYAANESRSEPFSLGPIDLTLSAGELVFVIGGNGSGKSTFVKVLVGLYRPQQGVISLGGATIEDQNMDWYREHFAVVFSDFHLFDQLLGMDEAHVSSLVPTYLSRLQIDHKVTVTDRRFSTIDLSQGQRKRLALLTAYLEDRSVYVFDEWAADQDPQYREVFYRQLLPELRSRGKCVVVITHDDRYFHLGDRVVKLEDGHIVEAWKPHQEVHTASQ
jgi:putative pyoverdin transport system ATP-binding/permease protein